MSDNMEKVLNYLKSHEDLYVQRLKEWVAVPSVSASPEHRPDVIRMVHKAKSELEVLGASVELVDIGEQELPGGSGRLKLPPILCAKLGEDPNKKTILIYGHLDVQPAAKADGWDTEPFVLIEKEDGKMCGRGSSDDKGPVLGWLNVIEAFQKCQVDLPVNLRLFFEGMEESGSQGLVETVKKEKNNLFKDVDFICISDSNWTSKTKPCLNYGLRGICYFFLSIECAKRDLHSGMYGGVVHEAMTELVRLMATLVDEQGRILIPGIDEMVAPLTQEEKSVYPLIDFELETQKEGTGCYEFMHKTKEDYLMATWRYPCLSLHGIEGAFHESGSKTVIPRKVIGKFSIRLVPDMDSKKVEQIVFDYVKAEFAKLKSPNKMVIEAEDGSEDAWVTDFNNDHYKAARTAMKSVFGVEPDLVRAGGSIPITLTLENELQKSVLLLPMGAEDDNPHSQNEKLDKFNYFNGMQLFAQYFHEVSKISS